MVALTTTNSPLPIDRKTLAAIDGLTRAIETHAFSIRAAIKSGDWSQAHSCLSDLSTDFNCLDSIMCEKED